MNVSMSVCRAKDGARAFRRNDGTYPQVHTALHAGHQRHLPTVRTSNLIYHCFAVVNVILTWFSVKSNIFEIFKLDFTRSLSEKPRVSALVEIHDL